jgi:type IV pilus assembly protein PilC
MSQSSPPTKGEAGRLSPSDAEMLAVYVAELSAAGLPLAPGLRAAAEESGGRLAAALASMAEGLERGRSLEDVLSDRAARFPRYLQGLVRAALRTGQIGETLIDLVEHRRFLREQWRMVTSALAYPTVLLVLALGIFLLFASLLAPAMRSMFIDFDFELPVISRWLLWVGEWGTTLFLGALAGAAIAVIIARLAMGAARWRWLVAQIPLFGPLWHWTAVAEMCRLLSALVKRSVPVPESLRLTADGMSDANVAAACRELAAGVDEGRELAMLVVLSSRLPASMAPLVRWGDVTGQLGEALDAAAEMFEGRVRMRAALLRSVLPPFVFIAAAAMAVALFLGFLGPMIA